VKPTFKVGLIFWEDPAMDRDKWQSKYSRSKIEIIADILRMLRLGNTGRTQITAYASLKQDQAAKYINRLLEAGLLENAEEEMGLPSFRITRRGLAILGLIENIKEMLPADGRTEILHDSKVMEINVGRVLMTRGVAELVRRNRKFASFVKESLGRHRRGDWGEMSDEVRQLNNQNLGVNTRLFSWYELKSFPEIWITTEPDRSFTTIMFPDEDISMEPREDYSLFTGVEAAG
jgi:predicted transcriptional regulator